MNELNNVQWFLVVMGVFLVGFILWGKWNRDNKGAVLWAIGIFALLFFLLSVSACTTTEARRPWLEAGVAYDTQGTVGGNPACIVRLRANLGDYVGLAPDRIIGGYTHHSSCPDLADANTIDQFEIVAKIPLGRSR